MNRESMKEISSVVTVEVTFVAYDIYKQEGGNLFSNSRELLVVQLLVLMTPHVLAKSDTQMMSACTIYILLLLLYLTKAYFCSFKIFEIYSKADHVVCNIEPAFISRSLLQFRHIIIYRKIH